MRRALPASLLTVLALVALTRFKTTPLVHTLKIASAPVRVAVPTTAPPPPPRPVAKPRKRTPAVAPTTPTVPTTLAPLLPTAPITAPPAPVTQAPPPVTHTTTPSTETVDGAPIDNNFGTVQVAVTIRAHQIVAVQPLQMPYQHATSAYISQQAAPLLQQEALQAQSANIQIISGATYTSESYAQSLQSALAKAHF